jgi:DNA repair protein RadC
MSEKNNQMVKIKELPEEERPYEKLVSRGVENLSTDEILAILLKSGYRSISSKNLANIILKETNGLIGLSEYRYEQLINIKGIGMSKACIILAAIELFRRIEQEKVKIKSQKLTSATMVYEYYRNKISDKKQECFYVVYLDNSKKIIADKLLFMGTINHSVVHPREIYKEAYLLSASAIILVHNHPSGNTIPSKEDLEITKKIFEVGFVLGIKLVDHIIVGSNNYYSLLENNDLK